MPVTEKDNKDVEMTEDKKPDTDKKVEVVVEEPKDKFFGK